MNNRKWILFGGLMIASIPLASAGCDADTRMSGLDRDEGVTQRSPAREYGDGYTTPTPGPNMVIPKGLHGPA